MQLASPVDIVVEQLFLQMGLDDSVGDAVVEQRSEIVMRRRQESVLEIDNPDDVLVNHQVPAMVIAVIQARYLAIQTLRDGGKNFSQLRDFRGADAGAGPLLQTVFDEMFELPHVKFKIEALVKGDAGLVAFFAAADLQVSKVLH